MNLNNEFCSRFADIGVPRTTADCIPAPPARGSEEEGDEQKGDSWRAGRGTLSRALSLPMLWLWPQFPLLPARSSGEVGWGLRTRGLNLCHREAGNVSEHRQDMIPAGLQEMDLAQVTRNSNDLASANLFSLVCLPPSPSPYPAPNHRRFQDLLCPGRLHALLLVRPLYTAFPRLWAPSLPSSSYCQAYYLGLKFLTRLCVQGRSYTPRGVPGTQLRTWHMGGVRFCSL